VEPRKINRRKFLRLIATGAGAAVFVPRLGWALGAPGQLGQATGLAPYSMQLHLHANSNHNYKGTLSQHASLQYHSDWASSEKVNTLWWSEHHNTMFPWTDYVIPLETGQLDSQTLSVVNLADPFNDVHSIDSNCCSDQDRGQIEAQSGPNWYAASMDAVIRGKGKPAAVLNGPKLVWQLKGGKGGGSFSYAPRNQQGQVVGGHFLAKALFGNVVITIDVQRGDVGPNQGCEITVFLAYRRVNSKPIRQSIIYNLVAQPGAPVVDNQTVTIPVVVPNAQTWTTLQLKLTADAQQWLPNGMDNNITDLEFKVLAGSGYTSQMAIRNLNIHSIQQDGPTNWATGKALAERYMSPYPSLTQLYGVEMSVPHEQHLNIFLPTAVNQLPDPRMTLEQLTAWAHSLGGLASFNHPFGLSEMLNNYQDLRTIVVAEAMLSNQAYGADMIEIYTKRGGADLEHHLELWDYLTAYGLNLLGIGTSDSHGGPWHENDNYFVTWAWAGGPDQDSLVAGMQSRLLYFGSIFRFNNASLNYNAGGGTMGGTTIVTSDMTTVNLQLTGDHPNWEHRLRQYLVQPYQYGKTLNLISLVGTPQQPWLVFTGDRVRVNTSRSSFVRIEIWDKNHGKPVAFGQTIVLNRT
jgi:hypothetical protein